MLKFEMKSGVFETTLENTKSIFWDLKFFRKDILGAAKMIYQEIYIIKSITLKFEICFIYTFSLVKKFKIQ